MSNSDPKHEVVSRSQWLAARRQLWLHEKAFTHQRDELSAARQALPWVKLDHDYRFHGPAGEVDLAALFGGRSQLLFNRDFAVSVATDGSEQYNYEPYQGDESELPGLSAFYRAADGQLYHTYSTYARGLDILVGAYNFLDLAPLGRNEGGTMDWVRHHDRYEQQPGKPHCCHD